MDAKPKVLFLLFEGLAATVVESQVLANVRLLKERDVGDFEVWAFACLSALLQSSRKRQAAAAELALAQVKVFRGVRPLTFLAYLTNVLLLAWRLFPRRREFTHIHARTDYSAAVAGPVAKLLGLKLIWDCRGDAVAEVEERFQGRKGLMRALVWLRIREIEFYSWMAGSLCTSALFVTDELKSLHRQLIGRKPAEVVPCAAHEEMFFFDSGLRESMRRRLGYDNQNTVYVYSGSLTAYQCFGETVALFRLAYANDAQSRLLVLTPAVSQANEQLHDLPAGSFQVHVCSLAEMNGYLNASDVGFLLRHPLRTNFVASPTKFAEYCMAGLAVVTSEAVPYAFRMAKLQGTLVSIENRIRRPSFDRAAVARHFRERLGRGMYVEHYRRVYEVAQDNGCTASND